MLLHVLELIKKLMSLCFVNNMLNKTTKTSMKLNNRMMMMKSSFCSAANGTNPNSSIAISLKNNSSALFDRPAYVFIKGKELFCPS